MRIIHSLILCSGGEQGSRESAFTATCLPLFSSLLPFLLMHFKGKRDKNTWLAMIFCHLFSCLMEAALTDSRKVCVAVHYFQKNLNASVFSQMQSVMLSRRHWPIHGRRPARLGTRGQPHGAVPPQTALGGSRCLGFGLVFSICLKLLIELCPLVSINYFAP